MGDEVFLRGEAAQIAAVFAEHHFHRLHPEGIDLRYIPWRFASCPRCLIILALLVFGKGAALLRPLLIPFHIAQFADNLLFIRPDPFLHRVVHL
jgi:hypothetical protein